MWPQIISSLAAAIALALAAVMLNSPIALLILAACCMFAWMQHNGYAGDNPRLGNAMGVIGLALSFALWLYLLFLAI